MENAQFITEGEYLETEIRSEFKREYLGGVVYAMAGASEAHNVIAANLMGCFTRTCAGNRASLSAPI